MPYFPDGFNFNLELPLGLTPTIKMITTYEISNKKKILTNGIG